MIVELFSFHDQIFMKEFCLRCELFADDLNFTLNGTCMLLIELHHPLLKFNTCITVKIILHVQVFIQKRNFTIERDAHLLEAML